MSPIKSLIIPIIIVGICLGLFAFQSSSDDGKNQSGLSKYLELVKKDPDNCLYNEQIAAHYQAQNKIDDAIKYYEIVLNKCPENLISIFDIGLCFYVKMEKNKGLKFMDLAIERASKSNNKSLKAMFIKEKASWLEKWDSIKELEWNKQNK